MSFGLSIGDFITLFRLASEVYDSFSEAPDDFRNLSDDAHRLLSAMQGVPQVLEAISTDIAKQNQFQPILQGCENVLRDLKTMLVQFSGLASPTGSIRDRFRWSRDDSRDLRLRLISNLASLTNFYACLNVASLARIERVLTPNAQEWSHIFKSPQPTTISLTPIAEFKNPLPPSPRPLARHTSPISLPQTLSQTYTSRSMDSTAPRGRTLAHKPSLSMRLHNCTRSRQDLIDAIELRDLQKVRYLVREIGRDVNYQSSDGTTPLSRAVQLGNAEMVRCLLDLGARISECGKGGLTPLGAAASAGKVDVVRVLLDGGANIEGVDSCYGATPLHLAIQNGELGVVDLLLGRGANPHATDGYQRSVLGYMGYVSLPDRRKAILNMLKDYGVMESVDEGKPRSSQRIQSIPSERQSSQPQRPQLNPPEYSVSQPWDQQQFTQSPILELSSYGGVQPEYPPYGGQSPAPQYSSFGGYSYAYAPPGSTTWNSYG